MKCNGLVVVWVVAVFGFLSTTAQGKTSYLWFITTTRFVSVITYTLQMSLTTILFK